MMLLSTMTVKKRLPSCY